MRHSNWPSPFCYLCAISLSLFTYTLIYLLYEIVFVVYIYVIDREKRSTVLDEGGRCDFVYMYLLGLVFEYGTFIPSGIQAIPSELAT